MQSIDYNGSNYQLIGPFKQILTMQDLPIKGPLDDHQLMMARDFGILVKDGFIHEVGNYSDLTNFAKLVEANVIYLEEDYVCLPGFIDSHTHICFEGSRARDYALRNTGKTYLEIAASGGGIWDTVTQVRRSSSEKLEASLFKRASRHLIDGITTIEVKSGYGLSVQSELKMLEAIRSVNTKHKVDLVSTCLAAHTLPKDFDEGHQDYLRQVEEELLPKLIHRDLTKRVDIFIEEGAFSVEMGREYLQRAKTMGFDITVHADQFSAGGSALAVEVGALSADHLEASGPREIERLANSEVIAIALPGASLGLGCDFTPARKLLDADGALAIASDWNPGSGPMGDLLCQAAILGTYEKLSTAEVLAGITFRAAAALGMKDRGRLIKGNLADFNLFEGDDYREILYHQGRLKPARVYKRGELIIPCL